ncbi:hypothetical protein ACWEV4_32785 [Streptomyces sp. NPDC003860]
MWLTDEGRFVIWWLLGFAAVNVLLGCWSLLRGWPDRAVIRRATQDGIGPTEAAWQAAYDWERPKDAAKTAAYLLVDARAVMVSQEGVLTAVPNAPEPSDPVLRALLDGVRRRGAAGARIHEAPDHGDFEPYRSLLAERVPTVRWYVDPCRTVAFYAGWVVTFGILVHGRTIDEPSPGSSNGAALWALAWMSVGGVLWLCARTWPDEYTRRWPDFTRYCRERVDTALEQVPQRIRILVDRGATDPHRKPAPRGERGAPGSAGGAWVDSVGADSGGCGCGGGN